MNFIHLEYALTVAKTGSIRKAAQKLLVSQPYLSNMIKSLENELGYEIFERSSSGIRLTPQGQQFERSAERIIAELAKLRAVKEEQSQSLNICSYYAASIMNLYMEFRSSGPDANDRFREMSNAEVIESVENGSASLGITFFPEETLGKYLGIIEDSGLLSVELFPPVEILVFASKKHPFAAKEAVSLEELKHTPFVSYDDKGSLMYLELLGIADNGQLMTVSDRGGYYDAIRSGKYVSLANYRNSRTPNDQSLCLIPIKEKTPWLLSRCVYLPDHAFTAREKAFLRYLWNAFKA